MFDLNNLKVRGFRGFNDEQELTFNHPVTLLYGENHRGKSSTLNAIEWCLFGNDCIGAATGIRERIGWEVANRHFADGNVEVAIELSGPDGTYTFVRQQSSQSNRGNKNIMAITPDGTHIQGNKAEQLIVTLFRSSFQDFMATVYQHQEAIRAILTQEPRKRNEAIDRLLGLSLYREILNGISNAKLDNVLNDIENKREQFRGLCEQSIRTLESLVREERLHATEKGIKEEDISEESVLKRGEDITKEMKSLAYDLGVAEYEEKSTNEVTDIPDFCEWVEEQIDEFWSQSPEVNKQQTLAAKQSRLATLKGKYEEAFKKRQEVQSKIDEHTINFGDAAKIDQTLARLNQQLGEVENEIREVNGKANLVREAIVYISEAVPGESRNTCPLCGAESQDLLVHLQEEWQKEIEGQITSLEEKRTGIKTEISNTELVEETLLDLKEDLELETRHLEDYSKEIGEIIEYTLQTGDDSLVFVTQSLKSIDTELKSIADAIAEKRQRINDIKQHLDNLKLIHEIIRYESKKEIVENIFNTDDFIELESTIDDATAFVEDVSIIRSIVAEVSRDEAHSKIEAAEKNLDTYFCCITKHPSIPGLNMNVTEDNRTGLNSYTFRCKDGTDPTPILSQGDLNVLALSLFLGLVEATSETQQFKFLLMDDPTQSLGTEMKRELVNILDIIATERKLVIATPDAEFRDLLLQNIKKSKGTYNFLDWNESKGPFISRIV